MYIDLKNFLKKNNIYIQGVIHIGAHKGEELWLYKKLKIKKILLFEANPSLITFLKIKIFFYKFFFNLQVFLEKLAVSNKVGKVNFKITSNSQSSSILDFKYHAIQYPDIKKIKEIIIPSTTLNKIFAEKYSIKDYNMLNMDIQGAELMVLTGATNILNKIDLIYTEINFKQMYKNCATAKQLDFFLKKYGFYRSMTLTPQSKYWGDAIYLKKK